MDTNQYFHYKGFMNKEVKITTFSCFHCKGTLTKIEPSKSKIFIGKRGFITKNIKDIVAI